jgi:hypothetical protein
MYPCLLFSSWSSGILLTLYPLQVRNRFGEPTLSTCIPPAFRASAHVQSMSIPSVFQPAMGFSEHPLMFDPLRVRVFCPFRDPLRVLVSVLFRASAHVQPTTGSSIPSFSEHPLMCATTGLSILFFPSIRSCSTHYGFERSILSVHPLMFDPLWA